MFNPLVVCLSSFRALFSWFWHRSMKWLIKLSEVLNGVDYTWRWPCTECVSRVLAFEPSWKGSRIASTNHNPLRFSPNTVQELEVHLIDEVSSVSKGLLRCQVLQVFGAPVFKWLGGSIVAMLEGDEESIVVSTNHKGIHLGVWGRAGPFSAEIKENWTTRCIEKLVVNPISLLVCAFVIWCGFKVIDVVCESFLTEVRHLHCL